MRASEVRIETACGMDWQAMKGEGKKRFCGACQKHVHDLSQLSEPEARALLATAATAQLCVRYVYDAQGELVFDAPLVAPSALVKAKRFAAAALALALPMSLNACMGAAAPKPAQPALSAQPPVYGASMGYPMPPAAPIDAGAGLPADGDASAPLAR